jgi:uncharacterized protein YegL
MRPPQRVALVAAILAAGPLCFGQSELKLLDSSYDKNTSSLLVHLAATDKLGRNVILDSHDLRLKVDQKPVVKSTIVPAESARTGSSIVLAIDTSGSMQALLPGLKEGISSIVGHLSPNDEVAVITFDRASHVMAGFEAGSSGNLKAIKSLTIGQEPGTRLFDAIHAAEDVARNGSKPNKEILVFTDGGDTNSKLTDEDVVRLANDRRIKIFTIGMGRQPLDKTLIRVAAMADGAYFNARTAQDVEACYQAILRKTGDCVALSIPEKPDGSLHELEVTWITAKDGTPKVDASVKFAAGFNGANPQPVPSNTIWIGGAGAAVVLIVVILVGLRLKPKPAARVESQDLPTVTSSAVIFEEPPASDTYPTSTAASDPGWSGGADPPSWRTGPGQERPTQVKGTPTAPALAWLVGIEGRDKGRKYEINTAEAVLGRGTDADLRLDDDEVSRRHAKIVKQGNGRYTVVDMASTNGLKVNGSKVLTSEIRDGDTLEIGSSTFMFKSIEIPEK